MDANGAGGSELVELRRCVRDLAALAALPVVWRSGNSDAVVASLAEALLGMLRLDFIYVRLADGDLTRIEVGRLARRPSAAHEAGRLGEALAPWLQGDQQPDGLPEIPGCEGRLRGFAVPFGLDVGKGIIAAGTRRAGFPSETERLLLHVAANQASVILARQRGEAEREGLLRQVEAERARLSEVFHRAPAFMCLLAGPRHVFELANAHYLRLVGNRDIIGKPVLEALPEVAAQGFGKLLDQVYRTGEAYTAHDAKVLLTAADGMQRETHVDFVYQAMRDHAGAVNGILVQGVDLTERKRVEAELRAKDARLQMLMDNVKDYAVVITDAAGRVVEWAGGAHRITGFAAADAIGQPIDIIFTPEDRAAGRPAAELAEAAATGRTTDKRWHHRADGGRFYGDGLTSPLLDDKGTLQGFGKIFRDATAEWQAHEELARLLDTQTRRAALLARVAQASRAMSAVLSVDSICRALADEARSIIGAHRSATTLDGGEDGSPAASTTSFSGESARTEDASPGGLSVALVGHGGRELGTVRVFDKLQGAFTQEDEAILQQLAATASVGIENARLYHALKEQDRRKDEFLAMLAHELRNPLAPVRNGLAVLRAVGGADPVATRTRDMMERQVGHMVRLIDDLMDVSRISQGKLTLKRSSVPFSQVLDTALETSRPLIAAAGHALELDVRDQDVPLMADLTRLAQLLGNLLNNAAKYTPRGGTIHLSARQVGGDLVVQVRDDGVGIAADLLPKVFELFTQGDAAPSSAQGGLGIGLALARRLAEIHGGTLEASSPGAGQGSTFTLRLPVNSPAPSQSGLPDGAAGGAPPIAPLRVLVVDDNVDAAETFALVLGMEGHEVRTVHTGEAALELAPGFLPHVIFLDIGLPGLSGYEVAMRLRADARLARTSIVALTGWGSEADRSRARQAGFDHHLTKPVEMAETAKILRSVAQATPAAARQPAVDAHR